MGVCTECGGASRVQYDVGARCRTLLRDFNHKNRDKLKGVRVNVRVSNYNGWEQKQTIYQENTKVSWESVNCQHRGLYVYMSYVKDIVRC